MDKLNIFGFSLIRCVRLTAFLKFAVDTPEQDRNASQAEARQKVGKKYVGASKILGQAQICTDQLLRLIFQLWNRIAEPVTRRDESQILGKCSRSSTSNVDGSRAPSLDDVVASIKSD